MENEGEGRTQALGERAGAGYLELQFPQYIPENMMQKYLMSDLKTTTSSNFLTLNNKRKKKFLKSPDSC